MRGAGLAERIEACNAGLVAFTKLLKDEEVDEEALVKCGEILCDDIRRERERIGGDWAVAMVVHTRRMRDFFRSRLGPDLTFVVLDMDWEDVVERLRSRHGYDETVAVRQFQVSFCVFCFNFKRDAGQFGPSQ